MTLDPDTLKLIEDRIDRAFAANNTTLQLRIDLALKEAAYAKGVADSSAKSSERDKEGLARELYHTVAQLHDMIETLHKEVHALSSTVALGEQSIKTMQSNIYGDTRPGAPSIKADIDRLITKTNAIMADFGEVSAHAVKINNLTLEYEKMRHELRYLILVQKVIGMSASKAVKPVWGLFERFKWVRWIATVLGGTGLGTWAYETIRSIIEAANK